MSAKVTEFAAHVMAGDRASAERARNDAMASLEAHRSDQSADQPDYGVMARRAREEQFWVALMIVAVSVTTGLTVWPWVSL